MNENAVRERESMIRWGLSLALGVLVVLWRVVIPVNFIEITVAYVILVAALDLGLTATLIAINRRELKEALARKFTIKTLFAILLGYFILIFLSIIANPLAQFAWDSFGVILFAQSGANLVGSEFRRIFPLGVFISMAIAAPIWEEIAFRMAGRNLIKNRVLYVLATAVLFAFIHTANFRIPEMSVYLINGVIWALIYLKTKDVRVVMAIHFLGNMTGSVMAMLSQ